MLNTKTQTLVRIVLILALIVGPWASFASAQDVGGLFAPDSTIKRLRIGPHPEYTRILIDLSKPTTYQVKADFLKKLIVLEFPNVAAGPDLHSRRFSDKNLEKISVENLGDVVRLSLTLQNANTRFFHHLNMDPPQVVLDLEGRSTEMGKISTRKGSKAKQPQKQAETKPVEAEQKAAPFIPGINQQQIKNIVEQHETSKDKDGWEDYQKALTLFQLRDYRGSTKLFVQFIKDHPESKYLDHIYYLNAEAEFNAVFTTEENPIYEHALEAYKQAVRRFPKSRFFDHALHKLAFIYDRMNYVLEARTLYNEGIKRNSRSLYNEAREGGLASMLMKVGQYKEAYEAFEKLLKKAPKDPNAKIALFDIADHFYEIKDYDQAIKVYEEATKRWPDVLAERPEIDYHMAEIYYARRQFPMARKHYFDLVNLNPTLPIAHQAINRIGDSYLLEGKEMDALSVFDESSKRNPGKPDSQYGTIRMADIGVKNPGLPVQDIVFKVDPYFNPFKTYEKIEKDAKSVDILAEVTLSKGIAY